MDVGRESIEHMALTFWREMIDSRAPLDVETFTDLYGPSAGRAMLALLDTCQEHDDRAHAHDARARSLCQPSLPFSRRVGSRP